MELRPVTLEHGERYGRLTVLRPARYGKSRYVVGCDCGWRMTARKSDLMKGRVKSCLKCQ